MSDMLLEAGSWNPNCHGLGWSAIELLVTTKLANKIIKFFIFIIDAFITNYSNYSISLNATINVGWE